MRVMDAMSNNPVDWTPFKRERAAESQKILDPRRRLVPTMSQESVKTHAHAQAGGNPPEHYRGQQRPPTEYEERAQRSNMQQTNENCCMPINAFRLLVNPCPAVYFQFL